MANSESTTAEAAAPQLEGGSYEIIRGRLEGHAAELRRRLERLNASRRAVFGSIETALLATERITTAHNCVPRDLAPLKDRFLFGYNVHFGLKATTDPQDVFALYAFREQSFHELPLDELLDEQFVRDFGEIYRYYKDARFLRFFTQGNLLYMVFQVGRTPDDIKTLKWQFDGQRLHYAGNRSDHEVRYPPQHEYQWTRTRREQHRFGHHPHISIDDRVFVETIGGDLTIKVENNTDSGAGIYSEEVKERDQTLDDADIHYAIVGNLILLKIRPYNESDYRYIVFNEKTQTARRWDAIRWASVLLPDDHGLIFPNGYFLQTGDCKIFDSVPQDMIFERRTPASNGEDYMYWFRNRQTGELSLLQYNLIEQQVTLPLVCHGAALLHGGELICFKQQEQPQKHHALQIWRTPYLTAELVPHADPDSYLYKVGNREIVRGMAECHEILNLLGKGDSYTNLYVDLVKLSSDLLDSYFWIDHQEAERLAEPLHGIRDAAGAAVEEFEKVVRVRRDTSNRTRQAQQQAGELIASVRRRRFDDIDQFVSSLTDLRRLRGEVIGLRELRYVDLSLVDQLESQVSQEAERLSYRCVQFLLEPAALAPYEKRTAEHAEKIPTLQTAAQCRQLSEEVGGEAAQLEMLIDVVSNLKIEDATQRTTIIDRISLLFAGINHARSQLKARGKELISAEGAAEFHSQLKLLNQSVVNYLEVCDTPQKCDELLTRMAIQLEELEGRFAEFDDFVVELAAKRDEIYSAFESRKLQLTEARNRRAAALMSAAERILKGAKSRLDSLESVNDINAYFAADLMIDKVRDIVRQLEELNDSVRVDDIQSRLKALRDDAVRQLRDRQELFVGGDQLIQLGRHRFSVNVQPLDLTTIVRDGDMYLHLTGTNFFEPLQDDALQAARDLWTQELVSESDQVYRGEYLAGRLLEQIASPKGPSLESVLAMSPEQRLQWVREFMGPRYHEGYVKGVHDLDAATILASLIDVQATSGLLQFHPTARAMAMVYWNDFCPEGEQDQWSALLRGHGAVQRLFPRREQRQKYVKELSSQMLRFAEQQGMFQESYAEQAAEYLYEVNVRGVPFVIHRSAARLFEEFQQRLRSQEAVESFSQSLDAIRERPALSWRLAREWSQSFIEGRQAESNSLNSETLNSETLNSESLNSESLNPEALNSESLYPEALYVDELAVLLQAGELDPARVADGDPQRQLEGMAGAHSLIRAGKYELNYNRLVHKLAVYERDVVPRYLRLVQRKKEVIQEGRQRLRLSQFQPRVLSSFVRNKLIDEVYLPLIGDNLAKQIGAAGDQKRSDRMGLLLLVSPPGYGKTTLMEYIASRLGLVFMKINGPAIGHRVTSLDPSEATNAAAREELDKLNLALEMGDNIMLYLDDIQHCNPELLQKFISLCDAQRRIEGVYRGQTRTYDLRGRRVAVAMAGNPYTESGEKFQIPDMLSNRADIYNLGEVIGDSREVFELSYLENAMTSNPVLSRVAGRDAKDIYALITLAQTGSHGGVELAGNYSPDELTEIAAVLKKLLRVRDVVLAVNREYIRSAAQADEYRTEPPFKLQGSYRNMNRIAEKVVPLMNDDELTTLIVANYENDAQTLTSDTESNLLKFKQLVGIQTPAETRRWEEICRTYRQNVKLKGVGSDDKAGLIIAQLGTLTDGLESIRRAMLEGASQLADQDRAAADAARQVEQLADRLEQLRQQLENGRAGATQGRSPIEQAAIPGVPGVEGLHGVPDGSGVSGSAEQAGYSEESAGAGSSLGSGRSGDDSSAAPWQRVIVQHKVPRSILDVVKHQFDVMQRSLLPLLEASRHQAGEAAQLRASVESCLASYTQLLGELEAARHRKQA